MWGGAGGDALGDAVGLAHAHSLHASRLLATSIGSLAVIAVGCLSLCLQFLAEEAKGEQVTWKRQDMMALLLPVPQVITFRRAYPGQAPPKGGTPGTLIACVYIFFLPLNSQARQRSK